MAETRFIITDPHTVREAIFRNAKQALSGKFPIESTHYRAELKGLEVKHVPLSQNKQRIIIMSNGNASDGVMADIDLVDKSTGKVVLSLKNHRLMNLPYFTNRYTFLLGGTEYTIVNQLRTKSGVYTRKRGNDTLEASFNLEKGANFRLLMDPESGLFKISILHSTLPLFAVLRVLNADMAQVERTIGAELYKANNNISDANMNRTIDTLYTKLARYRSGLGDTASASEKISKIRAYFDGTKLNEETTKITLGAAHSRVNVSALLAAAKKILAVYNDEGDTDERDNLEFQNVYSVEDIVKEVITKARGDVDKIKNRLQTFRISGDKKDDTARLKAILSPVYFTAPLRNFITTSSLSRTPTQINAMEMLDTAATVTRLGEGAIGSLDAVPETARAVNYSYMGTIDPIATPESNKIGVDSRFAIAAMKGDDNELYRSVVNTKTNTLVKKRVIDLHDKYVGMPDEGYVAGTEKPSDIVPAVYKGKLEKVRRDKLDYQIPGPHDLSTLTTNALPLANSNQANRLVMGSKHLTQAMPLKDPDTRLVESSIRARSSIRSGTTMDIVGSFLEPESPVDGTVTKITEDYVFIKDDSGTSHKVDYQNNLPLASKTMLNNTITVKPGDKVKKGQVLGTSNFTKDGRFAIGKNLRVAYMPYHGQNHEDGVVISEKASKKLTSVHSEKISVTLDQTMIADRDKFTSQHPTKFTTDQLSKIDGKGVAKKGALLEFGDPVILLLSDAAESRTNQVLGALHKSLIRPYRDASIVYDQHYPAEVIDAINVGKTITVLVKMDKPAGIGDKLAGSYGNKGVISYIEKDDLMPRTEDGKILDAIMTNAGVPGRINPAQTLETTLGKIADKTGKPYYLENWSEKDNVAFVAGELKKHGVKDKENLIDPGTGKTIPRIFTGVQHIHKLMKTTETNYASRGVEGPHDQDETPVGSGEIGPKALGGMEVNALLAHNARNILKESSILRNSKNIDFWSAYQKGYNPDMPLAKKTYDKFTTILNQAGIKVTRDGNEIVAGPMTDNDVKEMSSGEIKNPRRIDAKDRPEIGGLFDPATTGGINGTKWSHVKLNEPLINPIFEDCVKTLLDLNTREMEAELSKDGGNALKKRLNAINVDAELKLTQNMVANTSVKGAALDKLVKKAKFLKALKELGLKAGDAYMLKYVPVTPPVMRPITIGRAGDKLENDANLLYRNIILENDTFKKIKGESGLEKETSDSRLSMQNSLRELTGTIAPRSVQMKNAGVKGAIKFIAGDQPKRGYFQRKVVYSKMNLSGRATISPDNTLGLDEVGMPEDMAWSMYKPFILRRMAQMGYSAFQAKDDIENRSDVARKILEEEMDKRPLMVNRAPTLWKHGILAAKPKLRPGKSLLVNTLWETGLNSDFDGDSETVHLPITDEAISDAYKMLPSNQLYSDKKRGDLLMAPKMEPIAGLFKVTQNLGKPITGKVHRFANEAEAWRAYNAGKLRATDLVEIG